MDIKRFKKIVSIVTWSLAVVWMLIIFNMSSQQGEDSLNLSKYISESIVRVVNVVAPNIGIEMVSFNHLLRKGAHFFSYLLLSILVVRVLTVSKIRGTKLYILSFAICLIYAIGDEAHQAFVPGRGPQLFDVLIDSSGSFTGLLLYQALIKFKKRKFN